MTHDDLQLQIDRLVGGDLSKQEVRTLVERFDASPDGWRQCGLAFLEAQSWQRTFSAMRDADEREVVVDKRDVGRNSLRSSLLRRSATIIVSALLGVFATAWWFQANRPAPDDSKSNFTKNDTPSPKSDSQPQPDSQLVGVVQIVADGRPEVAYQLVNHQDREVVLLTGDSPEPSEYDLRKLERRGFQVERHRKVVTVSLANGRRFQFPVDWRQYRYVGEPVF